MKLKTNQYSEQGFIDRKLGQLVSIKNVSPSGKHTNENHRDVLSFPLDAKNSEV